MNEERGVLAEADGMLSGTDEYKYER